MKVHNAICSCSNELYKQRFTLTDFLPNWDISRGFLSVYVIYNAGGISAAIRELYCTFADFYKTGIFLQIILISPKETAKLLWAGWGAVDIIFLGCRVG
jgi:hypothetical protein